MEYLKIIVMAFFISLVTACGLTTPKGVLETNSSEAIPGPLFGNFQSLDGANINLSTGSGRIQVLMFVSETCSVCRAETKHLLEDRATRGIPTNVDFYSILVGSVKDDATDWKTSLGVNWTVAINPGDALFRAYCKPQLQTPCLVLRNPFLNQYTVFTGELPLAKWELNTGTWSF